MIRVIALIALTAITTPALAECPEYVKPEYCNTYQSRIFERPRDENPFDEPPPTRRSYQPTYQEPIPEPRRPMTDYELDNAIRQIPGWNKQFPNYGR